MTVHNVSIPIPKFLGKYNAKKRNRDRTTPAPCTHTSFAGGSYVVPLENRKAFSVEYFEEFDKWMTARQGNIDTEPCLFLNERYTSEFFRFFIDVDYAWDDQTPGVLPAIYQIRKAVSRMLEYIRGGAMDEGDIEVRDNEVRPSERTAYKRHYVFPQVIVSPINCLLFAQAVEKMLHVHSDLNIKFDMKVYTRGSLRMLGSCKATGLVSSHPNETEFFYMPVDLVTGERKNTVTLDEYARHSILLDKETHDRVEGFMARDDGEVFMTGDGDQDDLYVTCKYIPSGAAAVGASDPLSGLSATVISHNLPETHPIYIFIRNNYGEVYAQSAYRLIFDACRESFSLSFSTKACPFLSRDHTSNHPYFVMSRSGASIRCHSTNAACCSNGVFNHIEFQDIDEPAQKFFRDECLAGVEQLIPQALFARAKAACEQNMASWSCVSRDSDAVAEPLRWMNGKFVTLRKNSYYRCMTSDSHADMFVETDITGSVMKCTACDFRFPANPSLGLMDAECAGVIRPFFIAIEGFKNRGISVFQELQELECGPADISEMLLDDNLSQYRCELNYNIDRVRLLHGEILEDGLSVFDDDRKNNAFILSLSGTDRDVAIFMELQLAEDFVATSAEKGDWYCFRQPRWRGGEYAKNLLFLFVDNIVHDYVKAIAWYKSASFTGDVKTQRKRVKKIEKVRKRLCDVSFIKKVMTRLAHFRLNVEFYDQLDANRNLLCFNDGVYDLSTFTFRAGEPEDKLSMTVGYDFPHVTDKSTCEAILRFFADIQPDKEPRRYLMKYLSSLIDGRTPDELFHIFSGKTRNGKSVLADLIKITLGCRDIPIGDGGSMGEHNYAGDYEPSFLTKERKGSSDPVPDLLSNRKTRALIGTEPESGDKMNASFIKKLTGGDTLSGRFLYSNATVSFKPHFKLILICNDIPEMNVNDEAVWKRARVIDFPVTFVDNPVGPNQRLINRHMKDEIRNVQWASNFMALLLEWHRTMYIPEGLIAPPSVLRATRQYEEESNVYLQWWNENTEPASSHVSSKDLLADFCAFINNFHVSIKEFNKGLRQIPVTVKKSIRTADGVHTGVERRKLKSRQVCEVPEAFNECI